MKTKKKYNYKNKAKCGFRPTTDPRVFGPELWRSLHRIAQNYPINPTKETKNKAIQFIQSLPYMLPCSHCGCDLLMFIDENNMKKVVNTKENFVRFFVEAHNRVSRHLNSNKKQWTVAEANKKYSKEYVCIGHKPVWKECDLVKTKYNRFTGQEIQ